MTWNSNVFRLYNDVCPEREDFLRKQTNPSAKNMNNGEIKLFIAEILMIFVSKLYFNLFTTEENLNHFFIFN